MVADSCFFAIEGVAVDGHRFIASAIDKGATAVVCKQLPDELQTDKATYIVVEDTDKAMALIAANFYGSAAVMAKAFPSGFIALYSVVFHRVSRWVVKVVLVPLV